MTSDAIRFTLWRLRDAARDLMFGTRHRREVFSKIYAQNAWGNAESVSGGGSSQAATQVARRDLPGLFERLGVKSLLDAPCGDFSWMKDIAGSLDRYYGVDIVPEIVAVNQSSFATDRVRFEVADISADPLPDADMVLCRDCFIHLPSRLIRQSLVNFTRTSARFLVLTNDAAAETFHDIPVGSFRSIDFRKPPFAFPEPIAIIFEGDSGNRQLCVWNMSDIRDRIGR